MGWVILAAAGCPVAEETPQPAATVSVVETVELDLFRDTPIVSCGYFSAADTYSDGDGRARILSGGPSGLAPNGQAQLSTLDGQRLVAGEQSSCDTIWSVEGSSENVTLGGDAITADLDGDGLQEGIFGDGQWPTTADEPGPGAVAILSESSQGQHSFEELETVLWGAYNKAGSNITALEDQGQTLLVVGAEEELGLGEDYGYLYLLPMPTTGGLMEELASGIVSGSDGGTFGVELLSDHDLTGDGLPDLTVADPLHGGWTGLTLIFESPLGARTEPGDAVATIEGEPGSTAGYALSTGDSDGDGHADLLLSAIEEDNMEGAAYLFLGPLAGELHVSQADASFRPDPDPSGAWNPARLGRALSLDQDLDGDGRADPAIGVPGHAEDDINVGGAYVWLGPVQGAQGPGTAAAHLFVAPDGHVAIGALLMGVPDVDGDGLDGLLVYGAYSKESEDEDERVFFLLRSIDL